MPIHLLYTPLTYTIRFIFVGSLKGVTLDAIFGPLKQGDTELLASHRDDKSAATGTAVTTSTSAIISAPIPFAPIPTAPLTVAPSPTAPLPAAPLPTTPVPTAPVPVAPVKKAIVGWSPHMMITPNNRYTTSLTGL